MELRHLRYFVAVGEEENMSRAAVKLHVSQPALSKQVRDLEDEIGFPLLQRTAKSVRLTEAGRVFLDSARAVLRRRLLADASRRNSAENPTGISEKNAKRARQTARLEQPSHSRRRTRWAASSRIDRSSREG
jgi:DNA-binding transcriptional LysR family regulator